jgi:hypothetical protein
MQGRFRHAMFIDISHISFALSVRCTLDLLLPKGPALITNSSGDS